MLCLIWLYRNFLNICVVIIIGQCVRSNADGPRIYRTTEMCDVNNGRRMYLELGDRGSLKVGNMSATHFVNKYLLHMDQKRLNNSNQELQYQCTIELVTCPFCVINITLTHMNFTTNCHTNKLENNQNQNDTRQCKCDYLLISEPPYDSNIFGTQICGQKNIYISHTRSLSIKYLYKSRHSNVLKLNYITQKNQVVLYGEPLEEISGRYITSNNSNIKLIKSPFFPSLYPRDISTEHLIICGNRTNSIMKNCRIRILFSDFHIDMDSTMEFYDSNDEQIGVYSGTDFRPPILITSGPKMLIKFYANGGTGYGFNGEISFLTNDQLANNSTKPFTDCGGYVENLGGAITMMNMVEKTMSPKMYDCYWLIRPPDSYLHLKTHMSLRVEVFKNMGSKSELVIRKGLTSDRPPLDIITSLHSFQSKVDNYVVPLTTGFYVSLRGIFNSESRLALVYAAFSFMDCYVGSEFLCQNRKCIPIQLQCDGFDHCGDRSDEPESCATEWNRQPIDRRWYSHTPNYYFPKNDRYPDYKTATLVFIGSSIGLIFIISALIVLLYKIGNRARQQRELQNQLQTISELLDNSSRQEEIPPEEPPAYEAPPDYDQIIKVGFDEILTEKEQQSSSRRQSRSSRRSSRDYQNSILEVVLPPELTQRRPSSVVNLITIDEIENATQSTGPSSLVSHKSCQTNPVPDSPPPVYKSENFPSTTATSINETDESPPISSTFIEDLIDISSNAYPPRSSRGIVLPTRNSGVWNRPANRTQNTWLKFENDEPTVCTAEEYRNQKEIACDVDSKMESRSDFPSIEIEVDNSDQQPTTSARMQRELQQERSVVIVNRLAAVDTETETDSTGCTKCGGTRIRKCSIDETPFCFGQITLFGHLRSDTYRSKITLLCHCEQKQSNSTMALSGNRSDTLVLPLRRSSSAELLPLTSPRRPHVFLDI